MAYAFAGTYGPAPITDLFGHPLTGLTVAVYETGTQNLVNLYTDRSMDTPATNPTLTDDIGNLTFFCAPGQVDISGNDATITVVIPPDPADLATLDGSTFTGPVELAADPTDNLGAATKEYVDTHGGGGGGGSVASVFGRTGVVVPQNADYSGFYDAIGAAAAAQATASALPTVAGADSSITVAGTSTAVTLSRGALTGAVTAGAGSGATAIVPQYTTEEQDAVQVGGAASAGSVATGATYQTTVASGSNGVSLTTLAGGTALQVAAAAGSGNYYGPGQITVAASGGTAVLSFTNRTATTYTGLAIVSGTGSWTLPTGAAVREQALPLFDMVAGCSIGRGDGGILGVTDWHTILTNLENNIAGLPAQSTGFVLPGFPPGIYGNINWATNSGSGITPTKLGSPAAFLAAAAAPAPITAVSGNGTTVTFTSSTSLIAGQSVVLSGLAGGFSSLNGTQTVASVTGTTFTVTNATTGATTTGTATTPTQQLASSILVKSAATIPGDTRSFRRVLLFFQKQTNGDKITFATTGAVTSSGVIDTNGSGLAVWDSGDLGYFNAGTGFTATWSSGGGAGVVLVGALYIQSAGQNGVCSVNVSMGGTTTGDWANSSVLTGLTNLMALFTSMGSPVRRITTGDQAVNDSLFNSITGVTPAQATTNIEATITAIQTASPLTQVVVLGTYNAGSSGIPGVGNATWAASWIPAIRAAAIAKSCTFLNGYARFGDLSQAGGDPWGLSFDYIHMGSVYGTTYASHSGRSGQQAWAEFMFEKLAVSRDFALSGTYANGVVTDGKIVQSLGVVSTSALPLQLLGLYSNTSDLQPRIQLISSPNTAIATGVYFGPGGSSTPDTALVRKSAGLLSVVPAAGVSGTGLLEAGSDTSATAAITSPTPTNGGSAVQASTTQDAMIYGLVTTSGTLFALSLGHTTSGTDTGLMALEPVTAGQLITFRLPAGWYFKWSATTATVSWKAITC